MVYIRKSQKFKSDLFLSLSLSPLTHSHFTLYICMQMTGNAHTRTSTQLGNGHAPT